MRRPRTLRASIPSGDTPVARRIPAAVALLAMLAACSPRPLEPPSPRLETATNNEPPTETSPGERTGAPAKVADGKGGAGEDAGKAAPTEALAKVEPSAAGAAEDAEPTAEPAAADPLAPLPEEVRQRFASLPSDPKPDELIRNSHYWISNELNQHLWYEHVKDLGGAYLGVGTDQNYMLAGWAKSELVVVVDFDAAIADLHQVYGLFFDVAETPDDFYQRWSPAREAEGLALIDERLADRPDLKQIRKAYKIARQLVWARLRIVRKAYEKRDLPTFATDQAQYDHVRTLWRNGRVFAVRGDFTANETLVAVGKAMRDSNLAFNVIYLSNVEQYVDYTPEWRRNFIGLPVGEKGVVVRTLGWGAFGFAEGEKYHYNVQDAPKFLEWLATSRVKNLPNMLYYRTKTDQVGLSLLDGEVRPSKKPPEIAE